jgi:hypothetical protein
MSNLDHLWKGMGIAKDMLACCSLQSSFCKTAEAAKKSDCCKKSKQCCSLNECMSPHKGCTTPGLQTSVPAGYCAPHCRGLNYFKI